MLKILVVWQPDPRSFKHTSKHTPRLSMLSSMAIQFGHSPLPFLDYSRDLSDQFQALSQWVKTLLLYFTISHVNPFSCWEWTGIYDDPLKWCGEFHQVSGGLIPIPKSPRSSLIARSQSWVMLSSSLRSSSKSSNPVVSLATPASWRPKNEKLLIWPRTWANQAIEPTKISEDLRMMRI